MNGQEGNPGGTIRVEVGEDGCSLRLAGVVDVRIARRLLEGAREVLARSGPVVLRLDGAEYLDAAALQVLLALEADLARKGRTLHVPVLPRPIQEKLLAIGLGGAFAAAEEVEAEARP